MKILGIISEYNPFHLGHAAQLKGLREHFGDDAAVVACMSGYFTQRSGPALAGKMERAELAVGGGVNLVLELGLPGAVSSADYFATAAVRTLVATGLPLTLCFGSEAGRLAPLLAWAKLRESRPDAYESLVRQALDTGLSYAAAEAEAAQAFLSSAQAGDVLTETELTALNVQDSLLDSTLTDGAVTDVTGSSFWRGSNNQLAVAYIRAVRRLPARQRPRLYTHPRTGNGDLNPELSASPSAGAIRRYFAACQNDSAALISGLMDRLPDEVLGGLLALQARGQCAMEVNFSQQLIVRLRGTAPEELRAFQGWGEGLAERVSRLAAERPRIDVPVSAPWNYWHYLADASRSRRVPQSRVQRAFVSLLLGLKEGESRRLEEAGAPFYLRVLAADKKGRYLLRRMRGSATLPIFTKTSDYLEIPATQPEARRAAELDRVAADLYALGLGGRCGADFDKVPRLG